MKHLIANIFQYFLCGDMSPFCGAADTACFGIWLTLPIGVRVRVDPLLPAFFSHLFVMILRVNPDGQTGNETVKMYSLFA